MQTPHPPSGGRHAAGVPVPAGDGAQAPPGAAEPGNDDGPGAPFTGAREELALIYDTAPVGLAVLDVSMRFLRINRRLAEINGLPVEAHIGRTVREILPALADQSEALVRQVVETGEPVLGVEVEGETPAQPGVRRTWIEDWSPLRDTEGRVVAVNVVAREVTEERAAARALREIEARLAAVIDVLPVAVGLIDTEGRMRITNAEMRRFVRDVMPAHDVQRLDRWVAHHPDGSRVAPADFPGARALRGEVVRPGTEFLHLMDDGTQVHLRVAAVPLRDEGGTVVGAVGVASDITEAKAAAEWQALLTREMDHRAKNLLSLVQAALRLTPRDDAAGYARAVEGRVAALARAVSLLASEGWEGAGLRPLLTAELATFLPGDPTGEAGNPLPRIAIDGREIRLSAPATQAVSMAVHELATNAVKHGALSQPGGTVSVSWQVDHAAGLLRLRWVERGGPTLQAPPTRRGFGTRVLDGTIAGQLGGKVERSWKPEGLICDITLPLERAASAHPPRKKKGRQPEGLAAKSNREASRLGDEGVRALPE